MKGLRRCGWTKIDEPAKDWHPMRALTNQTDRSNVNLGLYDSEQHAYAAYLHAKRELHPESNLSAAALPPKPTRRPNTRGTSGVRGVSFERSRNKWCVRVAREGKYKYIGYFDTEQEAAQKLNTFNEASRTSPMQGIETPATADNLPQGVEQ